MGGGCIGGAGAVRMRVDSEPPQIGPAFDRCAYRTPRCGSGGAVRLSPGDARPAHAPRGARLRLGRDLNDPARSNPCGAGFQPASAMQSEWLPHNHAIYRGSATDNSIVIATFARDDAPYVL